MAKAERPPVPRWMTDRIRAVIDTLPEAYEEDAWVGVRWRVKQATIAHLFGGEDQLFRIMFRGEPGEVLAFENMGPPYFRAGWGRNTIGLIVDEDSDWDDIGELVTVSYCLQAPRKLASQVEARRG